MMGSKYPEEKPYSFYDPQQDWEGLREGPPHDKFAPVSPQGPISPRASPHGTYPPELNHGYNRSRLLDSPHKQPFGPNDLEQDVHERPKQRVNTPFRSSEAELGYYNPGLQNPKELDNRSRSAGSGVALPPIYVNPNSEKLLAPQATPLIGRYGPKSPSNDSFGQRAPPSDGYGRGAPLNGGYGQGTSSNDSFKRGAPPNDSYAQRTPIHDKFAKGALPNDNYGGGAPPNDNHARGAPPNGSYARGTPPIESYAQRTPPNESYARETPPSDGFGQRASPNDTHGPRVLAHGAYDYEDSPNRRYGHKASPNDIYEQKVSPNDTYGWDSQESGYVKGGVSRRASSTLSDNYDVKASGVGPHFREEESRYTRGLGRGQGVVPLGNGRYEYGGLHQPERLDMVEDYNGRASTPAPISSEYAHQVYASVFSDPVYGGAHQLNSRAGYHEEPDSLRQAHHREDELRHPDGF